MFRHGPRAVRSGAELCGQVLPGDYRLLELLHEDDERSVYRALQLVLGREVRIELLRSEPCVDPLSRARFTLEARVASRLKHPNAVDLLALGHTRAGQPYVVTELVRGIDLGSLRRAHGPLRPSRVLDLLEQVASALVEAHACGVVHGDLRLEKVIVRMLANGEDLVKLTDFALAPSNGRADVAGDLHAVGVMMRELLSGTTAPETLARVLRRALASDPSERHQDALELHRDLLEALAATRDAGATEAEFMGCPSCASCVPIARHCCDCGRPLVLSSITVPVQVCA
ncbi:MAG: serine/threonine-protein kinase [Polyangiaceae bacterium]